MTGKGPAKRQKKRVRRVRKAPALEYGWDRQYNKGNVLRPSGSRKRNKAETGRDHIIRKAETMKKGLCMILSAAVLCALLAGCGKNGQQETTAPAQSSQEAETTRSAAAETEPAAETEAASEAPASNYAFTRETFPVMDGSTSMVPLGKAVASVLLGESQEEVADLISFHRTTQSFRNLANGSSDLLIVGEPNAAVFDEMKESGFRYDLEEIATDGLIFVVNIDNPVNNLTTAQIKAIYSGKVTNWKEVGGNDAPIVPFQRNEGAGSQALMKKLVMKDTPMTDAPSTLIATEMGELMESVKSYDNSANAIGYSVYYYANDMKKAQGLKILSVDGVEPSAETIRSRQYPHLNAYYCVIAAEQPAGSPARVLYDWMVSKDGQKLVAAEGYVAAGDPEQLKTELAGGKIVKTDYTYYRKLAVPENRFTRLAEGGLTELKPRSDYGFLYPYTGSLTYTNYADGESYQSGAMMGFFDEKDRLVTDPVFSDISAGAYYDMYTGASVNIPVWEISRVSKDREGMMEYTFAAMDGSFVCDRWYDEVSIYEDRIICLNEAWTGEDWTGYTSFEVYDLKGNIVFASDRKKELTGADARFYGVSFGGGFYQVSLYEGGCIYFNEKDGRILGPYDYGMGFRDGRAAVEKAKGQDYFYGVIDDRGNWIIDPAYDTIEPMTGGGFICMNGEGTAENYDRNGTWLRTEKAGYVYRTSYGFVTYDAYYESENYLRCVAEDGRLLFMDTTDEWDTVGKDGVVYRKMGAGIQFRNILTGKTFYLEGADRASSFYRVEDTPDIDVFGAENSYYDNDTGEYYSHQWVMNSDLDVLFDKTGSSLNPVNDVYTGEWYFTDWLDESRVLIRDRNLKEVFQAYAYPQIVNGKFIVNDDFACTCYDKDGNIFFSYSLINSIDD